MRSEEEIRDRVHYLTNEEGIQDWYSRGAVLAALEWVLNDTTNKESN